MLTISIYLDLSYVKGMSHLTSDIQTAQGANNNAQVQAQAKPMTEEQFFTSTNPQLWAKSSTGKSDGTGMVAIPYILQYPIDPATGQQIIPPDSFYAKLQSLKEDETVNNWGFRFGITKDKSKVWRSGGGGKSGSARTYYTVVDAFDGTATAIRELAAKHKGKLIQCVGFIEDTRGEFRFGFTVSEALNPPAAAQQQQQKTG